MSENIVEYLQSIGLTSYESKVYSALVTLGNSIASKIASTSGVPRVRIYDILATLENKGWVEVIKAKPLEYRSVSLNNVQEKLNQIEKDFKDSKELILKEVEANEKEIGSVDQDQEIFVTTEETYQAIRYLMSQTHKDLWFFRIDADIVLELQKELRTLKRSGVKVKIILTKEPTKATLNKLKALADVKIQNLEATQSSLYSDGNQVLNVYKKHGNLYATLLNYKKCIHCLSGWLKRDWDSV